MKNKVVELIHEKPLPTHVAIIMDGNGRWAVKRGLKRTMGHKKGAQRLYEILKASLDLGIKVMSVYAFSTENWNRPKEEIDYLMNEATSFLKEHEGEIVKQSIRIVIAGEDSHLPADLIEKKYYYMNLTKDFTKMTFLICLNYGSHQELVNAAKTIAGLVRQNKLAITDINEETIENVLYTKGIPPVDLLIRTSGEVRVSNFLLWQISYAEMYFTKVLWPDFNTKEYYHAIYQYQNRHRRFGALEEK
jgi:undecaprenyl diphosphate synthase